MNAMQWDDVRYFLALARHGSLSATARHLQVEHSTVARRVASLEDTLQLKLFDRLARAWVLTPEGHTLFERAHLLEEEMLALQRTALSSSPFVGRVRISAPALLASHFLLPHLGEFRASYPDLDLELVGESRVSQLGHGEADMALRIAPLQEPDLVARPLADLHYDLYGTSHYLSCPPAEQVFIGFDNTIPDLVQKRWLDAHAGTRRHVLRTNDLQTMLQAAAQGWGIALLPRFLARLDSRLHALPPFPQALSCPIHLVMHPDVRRAPRVRIAADFIISLFQQQVDAL